MRVTGGVLEVSPSGAEEGGISSAHVRAFAGHCPRLLCTCTASLAVFRSVNGQDILD